MSPIAVTQHDFDTAKDEAQGDLTKVFWCCFRCGAKGFGRDFLPASPDAKSRWRKFKTLITCPVCGDDKGHAGILDADFEPSDLPTSQVEVRNPSALSLRYANASVHEIVAALSADKTVEALQAIRSYDPQLAHWLVARSVRFGSIADLRLKVPVSTIAQLRLPQEISDREPFFWLPIVAYPSPDKPTFVGFQVRRLEGEPKYLTLKLIDAPLAHIALPTEDRTDGQRWVGVWLTEGILKAEVVAYKLGVVAVGALGTGALRQAVPIVAETARRWHRDANLFSAPIVLAPDSDARAKLEVARAFWEVAKHLQREGFSVAFAIWSPKFRGIDDALIEGETPTVVAPEVWLATLQARIRNELLQVKVRPRLLLDGETAQAIELPESVAPSQSTVAQTYEVAKRKEVWLQTFINQPTNGKAAVIVDASPTGSGKTFAAAQLKVSELRKAGLFVKRLVYTSPEIKRAPVKPLERFRLFAGRDSLCPFWERLQVVEAEGLTKVGK
ncbi:MAG: toprim domain-containing protein, partial [Armatimonadota bacterium]